MNFTRAFICVHTLKGEWRSTVNLVNVNMYSVFCTLISSKMYKGLQMVVWLCGCGNCASRGQWITLARHPPCPQGGKLAHLLDHHRHKWKLGAGIVFLNQLKMKGMEGWATAGWWWATGRGAEDNRLAAQSQSAAHQCSLPRLPLHRNMRMVIGLVTEFFSKQCLFCKTFLTTSNLLCIRPEHSKGTRHNFNSGYLLLPFTDCFQSTAE